MRIIKNFKLFEKFSSNILTKTLSYIKDEEVKDYFLSSVKRMSRERSIPLSEITDESFVYSSVSEAKEEFSDILGAVFFLISDEGLRIEIVEPTLNFYGDDYNLSIRYVTEYGNSSDYDFCITYIPNKEELSNLRDIRNFRKERKPESLSEDDLVYNNKIRYFGKLLKKI